jgi:hypothetical protein
VDASQQDLRCIRRVVLEDHAAASARRSAPVPIGRHDRWRVLPPMRDCRVAVGAGPRPNTPSRASPSPACVAKRRVLPMCLVRGVTFVWGRSRLARENHQFKGEDDYVNSHQAGAARRAGPRRSGTGSASGTIGEYQPGLNGQGSTRSDNCPRPPIHFHPLPHPPDSCSSDLPPPLRPRRLLGHPQPLAPQALAQAGFCD